MHRPVPDEVILGLLLAQPSHGYELLEFFRSRSHLGRIWTMSTSQIYAVLKRLEREGAIIGHTLEVPTAPTRVEYQVTSVGEKQLVSWLYDPKPSASIHRIRVLFLSRIFIANLLNKPFDMIVAAQKTACETQRDRFLAQNHKHGSEIERMTLDFVISQLDSAITWLDQTNFSFALSTKAGNQLLSGGSTTNVIKN